MNGHPPGAQELEQLRLRARLQSATTRRPNSFASSNTGSTASSNDAEMTPSAAPETLASSSSLVPKEISTRLFLLFLVFRIFNATILTRTFFQPDEYWQSLEVAHRFVFGYGYKTWEWSASPHHSESRPLFDNFTNGPIRSFAYPALFVPVFHLLRATRLDNTFLLTLAPKILQGGFAALGDLYTFRLSQRVLNEKAAYLTILMSYCSLYGLYTSTRTFSNSLESVLTAIGLYYWPLSLPERHLPGADPLRSTSPIDQLSIRYALRAAAAACIIRPTNAVIWLFLSLTLIRDLTKRVDSVSAAAEVCFQVINIIQEGLWVLAGALIFTLGSDSIFYARLTFTPVSFLYNNVFKSISLFYGSHPFHWYLSQGIPVLTFTCFPFLLHGIYVSVRTSSILGLSQKTSRWFGTSGERDLESLRNLTRVALFTILVFSFIGHKEFRFLQPLIPIFNILITYSLMRIVRISSQIGVDEAARNEDVKAQIETEDSSRVMILRGGERVLIHGRPPLIYHDIFSSFQEALSAINSTSKYRNLVKGLLLAQLPFALYLCYFHCKAQSHVHREALEIGQNKGRGKEKPNGSGDDGLMWFITCEPPSGQSLTEYKDQSDFFYQDPYQYLTTRFPAHVDPRFPPSPAVMKSNSGEPFGSSPYDLGWRHTWPSHLVLFENLLDIEQFQIRSHLEQKGYKTKKRLWNSFKHEDERRDGDIIILEWRSKNS